MIGIWRRRTRSSEGQKLNNPEKIISWLKYLDNEYLDDSKCVSLSELNINDAADHDRIIDIAMREEVCSLNAISRSSMLSALDEISNYPEDAVRKIIKRTGMPFNQELLDYVTFFRRVRNRLFTR